MYDEREKEKRINVNKDAPVGLEPLICAKWRSKRAKL